MAKRIVLSDKPETDLATDPKLLGAAVRFVRTSAGLTIEDAAALAGVSKQTLNDLERAKPGTRMETMFKVMESLGIKLKIELPGL
ncbi:XRE family transcriptional regulator [Methylophaga lonarensis MPL]|uniref:XRE family transcriptional regulator n=1 Tax=Methylophaga lonarensis MPL TaxID=1286106 RepID=M7NZ58_9GAMM|nr:helix-turn-helix domain-containing protein [Methylophaga lonarensis]EMR12501.1 XRE family transcriptional regulator [Methylophaga lonarensis MPL]